MIFQSVSDRAGRTATPAGETHANIAKQLRRNETFCNDQARGRQGHRTRRRCRQYGSLFKDLRIRVQPMANMPANPMPQENPASRTGAYCRHLAPYFLRK